MSNKNAHTARSERKLDGLEVGIGEAPFVESVVEIPVLRRNGNQKAACDIIKIAIASQAQPNGPPRYKTQVMGFQIGPELSLDAAKYALKIAVDKMAKAAKAGQ